MAGLRKICTWNVLNDLRPEKQLFFIDIEGAEMDLLDPGVCERFTDLTYSWSCISHAILAMGSKRRSVAGLRRATISSADNKRTGRSELLQTGTSGKDDFTKMKWFGRLMNSGQVIRSGFG